MIFYDISLRLNEGVPVWPGDPPVKIERTLALEQGDLANASRISTSLHWGTHIDAPYHFFEDGWTVEQIPLEVLIGPATVLEFPDLREIRARDLAEQWHPGIQRLLLKTRNSAFWQEEPLRFHQDFTALTADAAEFLLEKEVLLVGIDYLSLDLFHNEAYPVHQMLYRRNLVGIEGLNLQAVPPGEYQLLCLPLRIEGADGAPARVVLQSEE